MDRKKLAVEIARHCGSDNAMLTAEIDTVTNTVTCRTFDTYANALMVFDDFFNTLNRR